MMAVIPTYLNGTSTHGVKAGAAHCPYPGHRPTLADGAGRVVVGGGEGCSRDGHHMCGGWHQSTGSWVGAPETWQFCCAWKRTCRGARLYREVLAPRNEFSIHTSVARAPHPCQGESRPAREALLSTTEMTLFFFRRRRGDARKRRRERTHRDRCAHRPPGAACQTKSGAEALVQKSRTPVEGC